MRKSYIVLSIFLMAQLVIGCSSKEKTVETLAPKYSEKEVSHPSGNAVNPPDPNSKIFKKDHLAIFLDQRPWKETSTGTDTLFSLNGKPAASAEETLWAHLEKGKPFTPPQKNEVDKWFSQYLSILGSKASSVEWKEVSSDEEEFLASFQIGRHAGYIRIFGNNQDHALLIYQNSKSLSQEEQSTWKDLLQQANLETTEVEG